MLCKCSVWDQLSALFPSARDPFSTRAHTQCSPVGENREKPRFSTVMRLRKDHKHCFFTGLLLSSAMITLGRHTGSAQRAWDQLLAVGAYTGLSWKSHVEGLPATRSFHLRKLLQRLKDFIIFHHYIGPLDFLKGAGWSFLPVSIPEWSEEKQYFSFALSVIFPLLGKVWWCFWTWNVSLHC